MRRAGRRFAGLAARRKPVPGLRRAQCLHHVLKELLFAVIMLPAAAARELDKVRAPAIGESAPLLRRRFIGLLLMRHFAAASAADSTARHAGANGGPKQRQAGSRAWRSAQLSSRSSARNMP